MASRPILPPSRRRRDFLDLKFDVAGTDEVTAWLATRSAADRLAYIVTPNVDHMVRLEKLTGSARRAYDEADLCLCDSRILARLARLCGIDLPLVPGSDLTARLFGDVVRAGDRLCLIGGTAEHRTRLAARHPEIEIVQHMPPMGLLHDKEARTVALTAAAQARARFTLLAVGSPQQELLALEMREAGTVRGTALCIGASVDFLVGHERRAPRLVQRAGMEWAWRLGGNPRRLARRYLVEGPAIFPMLWRWRRARRPS